MKNILNNKIALTLTVIVVLLIVFILGFYANSLYSSMEEDNAKTAGEEFVQLMVAGDAEAAYNYTTDELKESQSLDEFTQVVNAVKSDDAEYTDGSILEGEGRTIYVQYVNGLKPNVDGNSSGEFFINLQKDGLDWKVESVTIN